MDRCSEIVVRQQIWAAACRNNLSHIPESLFWEIIDIQVLHLFGDASVLNYQTQNVEFLDTFLKQKADHSSDMLQLDSLS